MIQPTLSPTEDRFAYSTGSGFVEVMDIARTANTTVANLYVYFPSKLLIVYEIYNPWLVRQLEALHASVQRFRSPRMRQCNGYRHED